MYNKYGLLKGAKKCSEAMDVVAKSSQFLGIDSTCLVVLIGARVGEINTALVHGSSLGCEVCGD
jgi:hypothetical protein